MTIQFTNVNLDFYLKNPSLIGEHCYQLRKALSQDNNLIPKSFFANMLDVPVTKLAQIENGFVYDSTLAIRYLLKLHQVYHFFHPVSISLPPNSNDIGEWNDFLVKKVVNLKSSN